MLRWVNWRPWEFPHHTFLMWLWNKRAVLTWSFLSDSKTYLLGTGVLTSNTGVCSMLREATYTILPGSLHFLPRVWKIALKIFFWFLNSKETTYWSLGDHKKFFLVKNVTLRPISIFRGWDVTPRMFFPRNTLPGSWQQHRNRPERALRAQLSEVNNCTHSRLYSYSGAAAHTLS